jgi:hypothetical protein
MDKIGDGATTMAMGRTMMMIPGMGMMIGPVMMNEPECYGNSFP